MLCYVMLKSWLTLAIFHILPIRLSMMFRYHDHKGWNLRSGTMGTPPKLGWNRGGVSRERKKTCNIFETVQDRTKVTITD